MNVRNRKSLLKIGTAGFIRGASAAENRMGRLMREGEHQNTPPSFNFPPEVDDINSVPEPARPLYVKSDNGKFKYDDIGSLRNALENAKNERNSARGEVANLKKFKDLGMDFDTIQGIVNGHKEGETNRLKAAGDFDALKAQLEENHNAALTQHKDVITRQKKTIEKLMITDAARAAMALDDVQGNPTLLMPAVRDRVEVSESEDGEFKLVVKRSDGTPMLNSENKPAGIKDLLLELKTLPDYSDAFKGVNQSGGGVPSSGKGGGAPTGDVKRSSMSVAEKTAYIREHGQEAYNNLPM